MRLLDCRPGHQIAGQSEFKEMTTYQTNLRNGFLCFSGTDVMIFKNIFAKKFGEAIGVFCPKQR
jgi:hypothetical protein